MMVGDSRSAMDDFSQVIRINPGNADGFYHRGTMLLQLGQRVAAKNDLQRAAALYLQQSSGEGYRNVMGKLSRLQ
jgi:Flp pilus assembly protein TadD